MVANHFLDLYVLGSFIGLALALGLGGLLTASRNLINFLIYTEITLIIVSTIFLIIASVANEMTGVLLSFCILTIAAAEAALGFSLLIILLNQCSSLLLKDFSSFN